ncbi:MAG: NifU family protein [Deltaproteobacteria bacterium]|nr:NifU family protein [Deltaproteobacteria bacterium]
METKLKLEITEPALKLLAEALASGEASDHAIRVRARRIGVRRFVYGMDVVPETDARSDDAVLTLREGKVLVWVDPESAANLEGATIDFVDMGGLQGAGFKFENPQETPSWEDPVSQSLQKLLDAEINPSLAGHGGFVEILRVEDGIAYVSMGGGCQGCGQASATLTEGVERHVVERIPEITRLVDVTDHAAGENPYFE